MGIDARFEGKNDLMINGLKFSGNAAHIFKNKILHHGTILFASEMRNVAEALKINPVKYQDKAQKSVPKRVTNISEHLKEPMTVDQFAQKVMDYVVSLYPDSRLYTFTDEDLNNIQKLRDEKYGTHDWNYGKSPDYNFKKAIRTKGGLLEMNLEAKKGLIEEVKIFGDFFSERVWKT
jgi:lipoate-protein ligase A